MVGRLTKWPRHVGAGALSLSLTSFSLYWSGLENVGFGGGGEGNSAGARKEG